MFEPFIPGTVHHPLAASLRRAEPRDETAIRYPTRLNAMALQPGAIADDRNLLYDAGELVLSVARFHHVRVRRLEPGTGLVVDPAVRRPELVEHAARIMCSALGVDCDLAIRVESDPLPVHAGFGSSSSLIAAVATAVNHLHGNPVDRGDLLPYLTSNHGEEHGTLPGLLIPVQCIGGSAASGLYDGGIQIVAGRSTVVLTVPVPERLSLVIGVPSDWDLRPTDELMAAEAEKFGQFRATGERWAPTIAFRMLHEAMPAARRGDLGPLGSLVFDYRFRMGSIENCSFTHPGLTDLAKNLEPLWHEGAATMLSLSSVGPAFFVLTDRPDHCAERFADLGMDVTHARPHNGTYEETELPR
ncbi:GHMP family kinase ATP-binding protein [Streptomyces sp. NRRL F-5630]|uniref:GHMP family kinase ATP-binding protein n=1 Tax=Streptomyces sp. NRRL F-5630 TaxID=1463864 RepID=UPI003EBDFD32